MIVGLTSFFWIIFVIVFAFFLFFGPLPLGPKTTPPCLSLRFLFGAPFRFLLLLFTRLPFFSLFLRPPLVPRGVHSPFRGTNLFLRGQAVAVRHPQKMTSFRIFSPPKFLFWFLSLFCLIVIIFSHTLKYFSSTWPAL